MLSQAEVGSSDEAWELQLKQSIKLLPSHPGSISWISWIRIIFCENVIHALLVLPFSILCLPFFFILYPCFGRPPVLLPFKKVCCRVPCMACETRPIINFSICERISLFLFAAKMILIFPIRACFWYLDDVLFPGYRKIDEGKGMIMLIQGIRVGSTSFGKQLYELINNDDEYVTLPGFLPAAFPYIWQWKLGSLCCGSCGYTRHDLMHIAGTSMGAEFMKRHHAEADKPDTLLSPFLAMYMFTGPWAMIHGISAYDTRSDDTWEESPRFYSAICKKFLYLEGPHKSIVSKHHDFHNAQTFYDMYPECKFIDLTRNPLKSLQSCINFAYVQNVEMMHGLNSLPETLAYMLAITKYRAHREEGKFFEGTNKVATDRKIALTFENWVQDPEGAMRLVLRFLRKTYTDERAEIMKGILEKHYGRNKQREYEIDYQLSSLIQQDFMDSLEKQLSVGLYADYATSLPQLTLNNDAFDIEIKE